MKQDLERISAVLASDFNGPVGSIPIERLVGKHLPSIEALRARGLTWEQIARLLAGAGVRREDGRPFAPSHLRGVFGRQRKRMLAAVVRKSAPGASDTTTINSVPRPGERGRYQNVTGTKAPSVSAQANARAARLDRSAGTSIRSQLIDDEEQTGAAALGRLRLRDPAGALESTSPPVKVDARDRARVLALMRQSAAARKNSE